MDNILEQEIKTRIAEYRKTNGTKELNSSELEQVVGGIEKNQIDVYGEIMSLEEFNDFMLFTTKVTGYSSALEILMSLTGTPIDLYQYNESGDDVAKMKNALYRYWKVRLSGSEIL